MDPFRTRWGGWVAPLGIEYRVDLLNAYVLVLVSAIASVVMVFPLEGSELRIPRERHFLFYALLLLRSVPRPISA